MPIGEPIYIFLHKIFLPEFDTAVLRSLDDELVCSDLEEDGDTKSSYLSYLSAKDKELPLKGVKSSKIIQLYEEMAGAKHPTHMVRAIIH